jgi:hypothetical protein
VTRAAASRPEATQASPDYFAIAALAGSISLVGLFGRLMGMVSGFLPCVPPDAAFADPASGKKLSSRPDRVRR